MSATHDRADLPPKALLLLQRLRKDVDVVRRLRVTLASRLQGQDASESTGFGAVVALALPTSREERAAIARALDVSPSLLERAALGGVDVSQWGGQAVAILADAMGLSKELSAQLIARDIAASSPLRGHRREQIAASLADSAAGLGGEVEQLLIDGWERLEADLAE